MKKYTFLKCEKDDRQITYLTLNRPDMHNAFNEEMIAELTVFFTELAKDTKCRALVLTGEGSSFSAGADLNWMKKMASYTQEQNEADARTLSEMYAMFYALPMPVIALVNGAAYGGGVGLVACADVVIADEEAVFCLSEVKLGLVPAIISPYVMGAMGPRHCQRYFLTAERFTAEEAKAMGLVHICASSFYVQDEVERIIELLLKAGPMAVRAGKKMLQDTRFSDIGDKKTQGALVKLIAQLRVSEEGQEGLSCFLQKKAPSWQK